ncbi:MAG: SUMF1/EgtB/PvdO family nonheme iron enzyme [Desulfobacterales bacterium]|nr:SUMF1/EgtB/PvdO family nonheme iron enzyme [Desulfobacterales bacterium]
MIIKKVVFVFLVIVFSVVAFNVSLVYAANRIALVIGNSDYQSAPLANPVNDARDMASALKKCGFDVILKINADQRTMEKAADQFYTTLKRSKVGLFYYAGHGMQINGANYLIPVNAHVATESDVKFESVDVGRILGKMKDAGNELNIVLLDACRDNPFKRSFRTSKKGLARMEAPSGTIIGYATAPGSVAADGNNRNGVFTSHFLKYMMQPGIPIEKVLKETRKNVYNETKGQQVPWDSSSLMGDFYFVMGTQPPANQSQPAAPVTPVQPQSIVSAPSTPVRGDTYTDSVTGMEFVYVEGGCYQMGQTEAGKQLIIKERGQESYNKYYKDELPRHEVCVDGFWMAKYEVTQGQWQNIMGNNPSKFQSGDDFPVEQVSWNDAKEFITKLNNRSNVGFRLPTEGEWEYAARSNNRDYLYSGGNNIDSVAWYRSNSKSKTHRAGTKNLNDFGLYDMSGNVWEWCEDVYDENAYSKHSRNNPLITSGSNYRVNRGGSWINDPRNVRAADRIGITADHRFSSLGFRLCSSQVRQ